MHVRHRLRPRVRHAVEAPHARRHGHLRRGRTRRMSGLAHRIDRSNVKNRLDRPSHPCDGECAHLSCRHDGADHGASSQFARSTRHYRIESSHAYSCLSRRIGRVSQPVAGRVGGVYGIVDERSRRQGVRTTGQAFARGGACRSAGEAWAATRLFDVECAGRGAGRCETRVEAARGGREDRQGRARGRCRSEDTCRRKAEGRADSAPKRDHQALTLHAGRRASIRRPRAMTTETFDHHGEPSCR